METEWIKEWVTSHARDGEGRWKSDAVTIISNKMGDYMPDDSVNGWRDKKREESYKEFFKAVCEVLRECPNLDSVCDLFVQFCRDIRTFRKRKYYSCLEEVKKWVESTRLD